VRLDLNSVIFPLEGETFCTGVEFYLAMQLNCQIEILGGVFIPFKPSKPSKSSKPSKIQKTQEIFVKDPKIKHLEDELEKELEKQIREVVIKSKNGNPKKVEVEEAEEEEEEEVVEEEIEEVEVEVEEEVEENNFYSTVKELLVERLKYPKGSYMNLLYKFLANAGIGQMARGLNQKVRYDSQTNSTKILPAGDLISPLYAG